MQATARGLRNLSPVLEEGAVIGEGLEGLGVAVGVEALTVGTVAVVAAPVVATIGAILVVGGGAGLLAKDGLKTIYKHFETK